MLRRLWEFLKSLGPAALMLTAAALLLASGAGYLTAVALGTAKADPAKTVTVNVGDTGPRGPAGPPGPQGAKGDPGAAGSGQCPPGTTFGEVVFNTPGGHTSILTCIKD